MGCILSPGQAGEALPARNFSSSSLMLTSGIPHSDLVIATGNVAHISRFVPANLWSNIHA